MTLEDGGFSIFAVDSFSFCSTGFSSTFGFSIFFSGSFGTLSFGFSSSCLTSLSSSFFSVSATTFPRLS